MLLKTFLTAGLAIAVIGCSGGGTLKEVVQKTHPNGKPKQVSYYMGSAPRRTVFYFPNGQIQSDQYFNKEGKPDSIRVIYAATGQKTTETFYSGGMKNGTDRSWYPDGAVKSEANWINDKPEGSFVTYFQNGQKKSECTYKDGKREGEEISYDSTGRKTELKTYAGGDMNGIEQVWFKNGKLKLEQTWKDNVLNGPYTMYHENGRKNETGTYVDGKYEGKRLMFNERGRKVSDATFKNGELIDGTAF